MGQPQHALRRPALAAMALLLFAVVPLGQANTLSAHIMRRMGFKPHLRHFAKGARNEAPRGLAVTKLREIPHEGSPWTQGLEFSDDGLLVETSGDFPTGSGSLIRLVDPSTGAVVRKVTQGLDQPLFAEGISRVGDSWFLSTYEDHVVLEYDGDFAYLRSHPFEFEGWGLARSPDGKSFIATNSSEFLLSLDASFRIQSARAATCMGHAVPGLNELELVDDFLGRGPALLGNVINTRLVLVLDPATAKCTGVFHLRGLEKEEPTESAGYHVANGIAYNRETRTFWVTGKNWNSMFEVRVSDHAEASGDGAEALALLRSHVGSAISSPSLLQRSDPRTSPVSDHAQSQLPIKASLRVSR